MAIPGASCGVIVTIGAKGIGLLIILQPDHWKNGVNGASAFTGEW